METATVDNYMNYSPTVSACPCCNHTQFIFSTILWPSLIEEWRLADYEVEYINRQQGLKCKRCQSSLRTMALALAIMKCFGYEGLFQDFVLTEQAQRLNVLEVNEAGQLTRYLSEISGHILAMYPDVDMMHLPYEDESFDLIVHSDTLEHVKYPVKALSECYRVLKPGGFLAFTIPIIVDRMTSSREGLLPSYHAGAEDINSVLVYTEYGCDAWKDLIKAGFSECRIFSLEYPSAQVLVGVKLISAHIDNSDEQLRAVKSSLLVQQKELQIQKQQAQTQLEQTRVELQHTQTQLKQAQTQLKQTQVELQQVRTELKQALTIITAMESSKFWKLRTAWSEIKKIALM